MSIYIRPKVTGATVFFTVTLAHRGTSLLVEHIDLLRWAVRETLAERPVHVDAWVVLPDHMHAVWTLPAGDRDYGARWGAVKARFTIGLRRRGVSLPETLPAVAAGRYAGLKPGLRTDRREAAVWQRRFWEHHIRDAADYAAHVAYCWTNPVRHGLVDDPADWDFSSIHRDMRLGILGPARPNEAAGAVPGPARAAAGDAAARPLTAQTS